MYTGIVQEIGTVENIKKIDGYKKIKILCTEEFLHNIKVGASVSVNGTCFTVTSYGVCDFLIDAVNATLEITNIDHLKKGDRVNLERSSVIGAEVGGHLISGHIYGVGKILEINKKEGHSSLWIEIQDEILKYISEKGFLAVNGASLTIEKINSKNNTVKINLIPETIKKTNIFDYKEGDLLNIEIDNQTKVIVDTIQRILKVV